MSRGRLVLIFPRPLAGSPLGPWVSASLATHVALAVGLTLASSLRPSSVPVGDAMVVELAGGVPAAPAQPPGGSAEPAKPQIPPPPAPRKEPRESSFQDLAPKRTGEKKKPPKEENREEPSAAPAVEGPPVPSPGGVVAGPGGAQGSGADGITALDLGDAEFAWYRGSVTAALRSRWIRPVLEDTEDTIAATVAFEVRRDGTVQDVRVEVSSGVPAMDRSVLRAVIEASPLPPLPSSWREPTLPARFEFRWHPGEPE